MVAELVAGLVAGLVARLVAGLVAELVAEDFLHHLVLWMRREWGVGNRRPQVKHSLLVSGRLVHSCWWACTGMVKGLQNIW